MVKTAEEKVTARYSLQLKAGIEPRPLTDANTAILAKVRAEVQLSAHVGQEAESAEPMELQLDVEQSTSLGAEVQTEPASQGMESAVDQLNEMQRLRRGSAEACVELQKLKDENSRLSLENAELVTRHKIQEEQLAKCRRGFKADPEIQELYATLSSLNVQLKNENERLSAVNQQLVNRNKFLYTQLTERSRDATIADPVKDLCEELTGLQLQNDQLQQCVARHVEQNEVTAARRSQSAEARPAKSLKGFDVGDVVYVAFEYWRLMGKHPRGYDHTCSFVIVKPASQQGFWDICAKKDMRTKPRKGACAWMPETTSGSFKQQTEIQSLYTTGFLGDVPARLLNARPSPPVRKSECAAWIDLTQK